MAASAFARARERQIEASLGELLELTGLQRDSVHHHAALEQALSVVGFHGHLDPEEAAGEERFAGIAEKYFFEGRLYDAERLVELASIAVGRSTVAGDPSLFSGAGARIRPLAPPLKRPQAVVSLLLELGRSRAFVGPLFPPRGEPSEETRVQPPFSETDFTSSVLGANFEDEEDLGAYLEEESDDYSADWGGTDSESSVVESPEKPPAPGDDGLGREPLAPPPKQSVAPAALSWDLEDEELFWERYEPAGPDWWRCAEPMSSAWAVHGPASGSLAPQQLLSVWEAAVARDAGVMLPRPLVVPEAQVVRAVLQLLQGYEGTIFQRATGTDGLNSGSVGEGGNAEATSRRTVEGFSAAAGRDVSSTPKFRLSRNSQGLALSHLSPLALEHLLSWFVQAAENAAYLREFTEDVAADVTKWAEIGIGGSHECPRYRKYGQVMEAFATAAGETVAALEDEAARLERDLLQLVAGDDDISGVDGRIHTLLGLRSAIQMRCRQVNATQRFVDRAAGWWLADRDVVEGCATWDVAAPLRERTAQLLSMLCSAWYDEAVLERGREPSPPPPPPQPVRAAPVQTASYGDWLLGMLRAATTPYLRLLNTWLAESRVDDPASETFLGIVEERTQLGEGAGLGQLCFGDGLVLNLVDGRHLLLFPNAVPTFLQPVSEGIAHAGGGMALLRRLRAASGRVEAPVSAAAGAFQAVQISHLDKHFGLDLPSGSSDEGGSRDVRVSGGVSEDLDAATDVAAAPSSPEIATLEGLTMVLLDAHALQKHRPYPAFAGVKLACDGEESFTAAAGPLVADGHHGGSSAAAAPLHEPGHASAKSVTTTAEAALQTPAPEVLRRWILVPLAQCYRETGTSCVRSLLHDAGLLSFLEGLRAVYLMASDEALLPFRTALFAGIGRSRGPSKEQGVGAAEPLLQASLSNAARTPGPAAVLGARVGAPGKLLYTRFHAWWDATGERGAGCGETSGVRALQRLRVTCEVPWPLTPFADPPSLAVYNAVLVLLLQLDFCFAELTDVRQCRFRGPQPGYNTRDVDARLYYMLRVVTDLRSYARTQVADGAWLKQDSLANACSPQSLEVDHRVYLARLAERCLLLPHQEGLMGNLLELLQAGVDFAGAVELESGASAGESEQAYEMFAESGRQLLLALKQLPKSCGGGYCSELIASLSALLCGAKGA